MQFKKEFLGLIIKESIMRNKLTQLITLFTFLLSIPEQCFIRVLWQLIKQSMPPKFYVIFMAGFLAVNGLQAQTNENLRKPDYLTFQTGAIVDRYNSLGIRTFFEYQKDLKGNWQYGISYEHSRHFGFFASDHPDAFETNLSLLSLNGYYKINLIRDRLFWTAGLGVGGVHAYWDDNDKIGTTINASVTLNIRLTKKIYFESSPFIVLLPSNRIYFSTMNAENADNFFALSLFPFGVKVKL